MCHLAPTAEPVQGCTFTSGCRIQAYISATEADVHQVDTHTLTHSQSVAEYSKSGHGTVFVAGPIWAAAAAQIRSPIKWSSDDSAHLGCGLGRGIKLLAFMLLRWNAVFSLLPVALDVFAEESQCIVVVLQRGWGSSIGLQVSYGVETEQLAWSLSVFFFFFSSISLTWCLFFFSRPRIFYLAWGLSQLRLGEGLGWKGQNRVRCD